MPSHRKISSIILIVISLLGCSVSREAFVDAHPELNQTFKEAILRGEVLEGMTEDEVKASWGSPNQIVKGTEGDFYYVYSKSEGKGGAHSHDVVVFDKNGKVISSGPR